ncbi:MAG: hydrogen peroxide-inducible genes activator [Gammaproteobacteria bacterium]|nr:hydrogen peroxide-inducible genes activator [Gammaproteobacteria bacterium]
MTLTELRYIVAVANERHFGRAAAVCFVSQSTLSLGIKKLEDELGVLIFERGQKELIITPVGQKIVSLAERAMAEIAAIRQTALLERDPYHGPLRLGAIYTIGPYLFPSLLPIIHERAPQMRLFIEENYTGVLIERLKHGDIDVAIISLPFSDSSIETVTVYNEPLVTLIPSAHPLALKDTLKVSDLRDEPLLLLGPQHCFRDHVLALCPEWAEWSKQEDTHTIIEGGSLETIRYIVASGAGITIAPATAACAEKFSQRLISVRRFRDIQPTRSVALAFRKNYARTDMVNWLINAIHGCKLTGIDNQKCA